MNNNGYGRLVFDYSQRESRWTQESKKQLEQCRLGFSEEGKKFLNVWGESRHPLGRFLSHHAHTPFEMPEGRFDSIVGYWNWQMINGSESGALEVMRKLSGPDAQGAGGSRYEVLKPEHPTYFYVDFERMRNSVRDALDAKLLQALPDQHYKDIRSIVGRIPIVHATEVGIGHLYPAGRTWLCEELRLAIDDFVQSRLGEAKKNHD
ncbi:MAG: hypothetical protein EOP06_05120 [Proteobacteria bacterium]|nr:MAG: hypothetical protein EOP06_05120 [Pseudomonadota bacterium]